MPPLRDRKNDIEGLIKHFISIYSESNNKNIAGASDEFIKVFKSYNWPGNIRELENAIEGAVIMAKTPTLEIENVPNRNKFTGTESKPVSKDSKSLKKVTEQPEKEHIIAILNECNWNRNKAAAALGVNRTTLYNKMKKYNILDKN